MTIPVVLARLVQKDSEWCACLLHEISSFLVPFTHPLTGCA